MSPGWIILAAVQQSDGQLKRRPALVLKEMPPYGDLLICAISSQLRHEVTGFDELIRQSDPDFPESGLKVDSLIRLGLLATIPTSAVLGRLGNLSPVRHSTLLSRLAHELDPAS
ncbi:MAG: type II toxin-antitoxin system PemK/MazF family toxin [Verrucomicrobiales bacterium]